MRSAIAALGIGTTLTLAGLASCSSPPVQIEPPGPDPSSTPVFASDAEALAAAEELYGRYVAALNHLGKSGWQDTDVLKAVVRDRAITQELATADEFSAKGFTQSGDTTFDSLTLQQLRDRGASKVLMTVYVCLDVSAVEVVDEEGNSVVSGDRPDRQPLEVDIDDADGSFKVSRSEAWSGANFC